MSVEIYELESENLTGLGGPMGSEHTWTNWREFFSDVDTAKAFALKDYRKTAGKKSNIEWTKERRGWSSGDLRFVMYNIRIIKVRPKQEKSN